MSLPLISWYRGDSFGFSVFLNGVFLGSGQGNGTDLINATYEFLAEGLGAANVVTVVVDHMGA